MNMTDPIADMLTRIRNAIMARHTRVLIPASKMKLSIARILKEEGYIKDFDIIKDNPQGTIRITLKYVDKRPVLTQLKRVSRPG
ncbi:MAG TPA: 30S ribosomal protein S8, partial [Ktedonobacterales bacterium]